jgi:hypothetical protein
MTEAHTPSHGYDGAADYVIRIRGHLDVRWAAWFEGLTIAQDEDGSTRIEGAIADQAALHGVLHKVRDLGLSLISVTPLEPQELRRP